MTCSCCGGCCCLDGAPDPTKLTQEDCEEAGGTWHLGPCSSEVNDCRCCDEFKVVCWEVVYSTYTVTISSIDPTVEPHPCQPDPVNDTAPGTIAIEAGGVKVCGGESEEQYCTTDYASRCSPLGDLDVGTAVELTQYYERLRAVDDCSECQDTGGDFCVPGIVLVGCLDWLDFSQADRDLFCACGTVNLCLNPLP